MATRRTASRRPPTPVPLVLSGPPGRLRAAVSVENATDRKLAVRGVTIHRDGAAPLPAAAAAVLPPGTTTLVPVSVSLPATTAPGDYPAEVEVAGVRRAVVLRVEPDPSVLVSPHRLLAGPGSNDVRLEVTNAGNVQVPLARAVRAWARVSDLPDGARPSGDAERGGEVTLTVEDAPVLEPGDSITLVGRLEVPADLDPTRRHHARLAVGLADLEIVLLPRSATEARP